MQEWRLLARVAMSSLLHTAGSSCSLRIPRPTSEVRVLTLDILFHDTRVSCAVMCAVLQCCTSGSQPCICLLLSGLSCCVTLIKWTVGSLGKEQG